MRTVSAIYKTLKVGRLSWYDIRVVCGTKIYGTDTLKSITVNYSLGSESGMSIGNANSAKCELTVVEESANWERMAEFIVQFRLRNETGTTNSEWITVGTFFTDERHDDKYGNLSIVGFDAMLKTEKYWTETVPEQLLPSEYPITARAFAQMVSSAGICAFEDISKLDNTSAFIGFDTESTVRDKLKDIASAHGGNWMCAPDGRLRLVQYEQFEIDATLAGVAIAGIAVVGRGGSSGNTRDYTLLNLSVKTFDKSPELPPVSGVTLETETGVSISAGSDTSYMLRGTCNFSSTDCGIETMCLGNVVGYSYRPFDITGAYLDPITEIGDFVLVDGVGYQIMNIDWNFNKMPKASLSAPYDEEVDHEYTVVDPRTKNYRKSMKAIDNAKGELNTAITQTAEAIELNASRIYETKTDASDKLDEAKSYSDAQIQVTADSITSTVAASQKQYDTSQYTISYYGYGAPSTTKYPPEDHSGEYYLDQADGSLYYCNGYNWSKSATLNLITTTQQTAIQQNATDITAKVSKTGGQNGSGSFSWHLTDSGHNWYANGASDPVVSITGSGLAIKGKVTATSGYIGNGRNGFEIGSTYIRNGVQSMQDTTHNGVYVGTDGISLGKGTFKATSTGAVTATNLELKGGSIKLGGTDSNPVFSVTSAGAVTATNMSITGGSISIRDGNNNVIFSANSSGVTVNGNGRFTGTVYAGNIVSEQTQSGAGYFNGGGIATGTVTGGLSTSGTATGGLSVGVCTSLGYADLFNAATTRGSGTYPPYFCATSITALSTMYANDYYIELGQDRQLALKTHYHTIVVNQDGTVQFGQPTSERPDPFNVADTQKYKGDVAAITVTSLDIEYTYDSSLHVYKIVGKAKNQAGTIVYQSSDGQWNTDRSAYLDGKEDGASEVTVDTVTQYSYSSTGDKSVSIENGYLRYNNGQLIGRINIALNGNSNTATCVVSMDGQRVVEDARPRTIVRRTNEATGNPMPDTWNANTNKGYVYLRATTNNNSIYVDQNIEVDTNSAIYQAGVTAGQGSGADSVTVQTLGLDPDGTISYSDTVKNYYIPIKATLSTGKNPRSITITVSGQEAYEQGASDAEDGVTLAVTTSQSGWSSLWKKTVSINAVAKNANGETLDSASPTVEVDALSVYGKGVDAGASTAYVSNITTGDAGSPSYSQEDDVYYANVSITGTARGTKADGTFVTSDRTLTRAVNVSTVYTTAKSLGITEGAQTAYVSDITAGSAGFPSYSSEDQVYYANVSITATARSTKADGTYYTADRTITRAVNVSTVYSVARTVGVNDARPRSIVRRTNEATGTVMPDTWNDSTNTGYIYLRATTNNGEIYLDQNIEVDTSSAIYLAGVAAGQGGGADSVTVQTLGLDPDGTISYSETVKNFYIPIKATLSSGKNPRTTTITVSGQEAYEHGASDAEDGVTLALTTSQTGWDSTTHKKTISINAAAKSGSGETLDSASPDIEVDATSVFNSVTATAQSMTTSQSDYGTYDQAIGYGSTSLYTASGTQYGRIKVTLSNGTERVVRIGMPAGSGININDVVVTRLYSPDRGWVFGDDTLGVLASVTANGQTKTENAVVDVTDIVEFWSDYYGALAYDHASALDTDSNNYGQYDTSLNLGLTGKSYVSGSQRYGRVGIYNSDNDLIKTIRVYMPTSGSSAGQITIVNAETSASVNPYYNATATTPRLPYYAYISGKHYVYIRADSTGVATNKTQYIDINDIVDYAYQLGGGGNVSVSSLEAESGYDGNTRSLFKITLSNGSVYRLWADHA